MHLCIQCMILLRGGCPIRISTDQSLLAAPHGFSQRATSFIASWCQGIHRMPLSCSHTTHAQQPSTQRQKIMSPGENPRKHKPMPAQSPPYIRKYSASHATFMSPSDRHTPNPLASDRPISQPARRVRPTRDPAAPRERTNLFTLTKNQLIRRKPPVRQFGTKLSSHFLMMPGGGRRVRTDDPLLAKQVLSQLSYAPTIGQHSPDSHPDQLSATSSPGKQPSQTPDPSQPETLVGQGGLEPPTPRLSSVCSNQLSY